MHSQSEHRAEETMFRHGQFHALRHAIALSAGDSEAVFYRAESRAAR